MNSFPNSGPSSAVGSIADLDGYTIRDYNSYLPADQDEFGFDPPEQKAFYPKMNQTYSPREDSDASPLGDWPDFEREDEGKHKHSLESYQLDKLMIQNLANAGTAITRFGQVTPTRTNSSGSVGTESVKHEESLSPRTPATVGRRKSVKQSKDAAAAAPKQTGSGRKRKNTRKAAANAEPSTGNGEDTKRKASLEKNRVAAAKCRINKKEKTEQLQRDSHDKAVHNAYLKDQVMHMKQEVQQLNALLLAHASCDGCKSPEEIQKHLQELSAEYLPQQMSVGGYPDYDEMSMDGMPQASDGGYFSMPAPHPSMLNPPLPEFNRSADFEVHTPMQAD